MADLTASNHAVEQLINICIVCIIFDTSNMCNLCIICITYIIYETLMASVLLQNGYKGTCMLLYFKVPSPYGDPAAVHAAREQARLAAAGRLRSALALELSPGLMWAPGAALTTRSRRRPQIVPMTWSLPQRARQQLSAWEADSDAHDLDGSGPVARDWSVSPLRPAGAPQL